MTYPNANTCKKIVIAGAQSGVGKTSISLALVAALKQRGVKVQTFKIGPDFLDPTYLELASGRPCYNLDSWMTGKEYVKKLFDLKTQNADVAVIEGVMGLYDGANPVTSEGSTAEIANLLKAPVLLVVSAKGLARSLAAMTKGYVDFDKNLIFAGIIANNCGSKGHIDWLERSFESTDLPPLLGAIPRDTFPKIPSRHLGLVTADRTNFSKDFLSKLANTLEKYTNIDKILKTSIRKEKFSQTSATSATGAAGATSAAGAIRVGLAFDSAFHFYYKDNLEALERGGVELVKFSPLHDKSLPPNLDGLYIGGGYPEEYAKDLEKNRQIIEEIKNFSKSKKPIYAECGGLIYLSEELKTLDEKKYKMIGILPGKTRMLDKRKSLGYIEATLKLESLFGKKNDKLRGHEFHYSELIDEYFFEKTDDWKKVYEIKRHNDKKHNNFCRGFQKGNILATYMHTHFASHPKAVKHFIEICKNFSSTTGATSATGATGKRAGKDA